MISSAIVLITCSTLVPVFALVSRNGTFSSSANFKCEQKTTSSLNPSLRSQCKQWHTPSGEGRSLNKMGLNDWYLFCKKSKLEYP